MTLQKGETGQLSSSHIRTVKAQGKIKSGQEGSLAFRSGKARDHSIFSVGLSQSTAISDACSGWVGRFDPSNIIVHIANYMSNNAHCWAALHSVLQLRYIYCRLQHLLP
jgi:hypothetical protein